MVDSLLFPLKDVLKRHYESRGGSWNGLALAIEAANEGNSNDPCRKVDRRKLKQLCSDDYERVSLTIGELKAIDQFLLRYNEGLAEHPIFARQLDLLDAFLDSDQLHFFVAAKDHPDLGVQAISRWDLRAITRLIRSKVAPLDLKLWDIAVREDWSQARQAANRQAKIAVGSPIASAASEALLAEMLNIKPFHPCPSRMLPFFLVRRDQEPAYKSAFIYSRRQAAKKIGLSPNQIPPDHRSIVLDGKLFTPTAQTEDFGLLVAQRHAKENQVHLVLCGLSGPATYGLAKALQKGMVQALPPALVDDKPAPILTVLFRVAVELDPRQGSSQQLTAETRTHPKPELLPLLRVFTYTEGRWMDTDALNGE